MDKLKETPNSPFSCDDDSNYSLAATPTCTTSNGSNNNSNKDNDSSSTKCDSGGYYTNDSDSCSTSKNTKDTCSSSNDGKHSDSSKSDSKSKSSSSSDRKNSSSSDSCNRKNSSSSDSCNHKNSSSSDSSDRKNSSSSDSSDRKNSSSSDSCNHKNSSSSDSCNHKNSSSSDSCDRSKSDHCHNSSDSCSCKDSSSCGCDHSKSGHCHNSSDSCSCKDSSSCGCDHSKSGHCHNSSDSCSCKDSSSCGCNHSDTSCGCQDSSCSNCDSCCCSSSCGCSTDTTSCNEPSEYYPSDYCSESLGPRKVCETPALPVSECEPSIIPPITDDSGNIACKPCDKKPCNGKYAKNFGYCTEASGFAAFAEGCCTSAQGDCSHAEGRDTVACDTAAHSEGYKTLARGKASHAEGRETKAVGDYSHAEGGPDVYDVTHPFVKGPVANGLNSHAEGSGTVANGRNSHAEGLITRAGDQPGPCEHNPNGLAAHSEGIDTIATGNGAHAEGGGTLASGDYSHAEGFGTGAAGYASHAEGINTSALGQYAHVENSNNKAKGICDDHVEGNGNRTNSGLAGQHLTGSCGVFAADPRPDVNFCNNTYNYSNQLASGQPGTSYPGEGISVIHKTSTAGVLEELGTNKPLLNQQTNGIYPLGQQAAYRTLADGQNYAVLLEDGGTLPDCPIGMFVSFDVYNDNEDCRGRVVAAKETGHVIGVITGDAGFVANAGEFPAAERIKYDDYHRPLVQDSCGISAGRHLSLLNIPTTIAMKAEFTKDDNTIYKRLAKHITDQAKRTRFLALGPNATDEIKKQAEQLRAKEKSTAVHEPQMKTTVTVFNPKTGQKSEVEVKDLVHRKKEATIMNERSMATKHKIEENDNACNYPGKVTILDDNGSDCNPCQKNMRSTPYVPRMLRTSPRWFQVAVLGLVVARDNGECIPGHQCNVSDGHAYPGTTYWVVKRVDENKILVWLK